MHSSVSCAANGMTSARRPCERPNRSFMSAARNEPSASAASLGKVIMDRPRREPPSERLLQRATLARSAIERDQRDEGRAVAKSSSAGWQASLATVAASVRRSVLMGHPPPAVDRDDREVIVGIGDRVAVGAIANLEIDDVLIGFVDQVMGVAASPLEAGARAWLQRRAAGVGDQRRLALQDVDELVLLRMRMADRGRPARFEARDVDAEIGEPERVAERPLVAPRHPRGERLGIVGAERARRDIGGANGDRAFGVIGHEDLRAFDIQSARRCHRARSGGARASSLNDTAEQERRPWKGSSFARWWSGSAYGWPR